MAVNDAQKERNALRRRRRWRQLLGAVVCLLVVIGLVSVVSGGVRLTATLFDDSELKAEYVLRLWRWTLCPSTALKRQTRTRC